jgi:hypothetical protein
MYVRDNIKLDIMKIECDSVDGIHLPQDMVQSRALVNTVMSIRVPKQAGNFKHLSGNQLLSHGVRYGFKHHVSKQKYKV